MGQRECTCETCIVKIEKTRNTPNGRLKRIERIPLGDEVFSPELTPKKAAGSSRASDETVVRLVRQPRDYRLKALSDSSSSRSLARFSLPRAAAKLLSRQELEMGTHFWCKPRIEVPAELARATFTAPELQAMTRAAALDLAAAHRPFSAATRFSAACFAMYSAARLMLAYLGFRVSESMRRDMAVFAGVEVFGSGTGLSDLVNRARLLREQYYAAFLRKCSEVSSEQANAALLLADSFHSEVAALILNSVCVPVATSEELISGKERYGFHDSALRLPLQLLNTSWPGTTGRWIALRVCHQTLYSYRPGLGTAQGESFAVVDLHRALPCSASDQDPADPVPCLIRRRKLLHLIAVEFGLWTHDPGSPTGESFAFEIPRYWTDNETTEPTSDDFTVLGPVVCLLCHTPAKASAAKRRADP